MIRRFEQYTPSIAESAYVDESAVVIGDVALAEDVSIWPAAVLRGDVNYIRVGARSNVQDGTVVHVTHAGPYTPEGGIPTVIGEDVTIGHREPEDIAADLESQDLAEGMKITGDWPYDE